jgi:competence protein ComEC
LTRATSRAGVAPFAVALARTLEAESDRWSLWIPVLFGVGIVFYFALPDEPGAASALALVMAAAGLAIATRGLPLGLVIGGMALAVSLGFATAKLRTEIGAGSCPRRGNAPGRCRGLGRALRVA